MMRNYAPHVVLIRATLVAIDQYRPESKEAYLANTMVQDAILMRLQEIGENLARIRQIDRDIFAEVAPESWYQVIGLRNIISHGYHTIRQEMIWQIISAELGELARSLEKLPER